MLVMGSSGSTVVDHMPYHYKGKGSNPTFVKRENGYKHNYNRRPALKVNANNKMV
jgi:hypothetical protein